MTQPAESLGGEQHLLDGSAHLCTHKMRLATLLCCKVASKRKKVETYGEQHDGDGECDGGEDSHTHTQDQSVVRINAAVSVKQFWLHVACRNTFRNVVHIHVYSYIHIFLIHQQYLSRRQFKKNAIHNLIFTVVVNI